jgi:hypothetical protein
MFLGTQGPDLIVSFDSKLVKLEGDGYWKIPFVVSNNSSAVAEHVIVIVEFTNPEVCAGISPGTFNDMSGVNPGRRIFQYKHSEVIHRGLSFVAGEMRILMKKEQRSRRVLKLTVTCYASRMRAKTWQLRIQLAKAGFDVKIMKEEFLY